MKSPRTKLSSFLVVWQKQNQAVKLHMWVCADWTSFVIPVYIVPPKSWAAHQYCSAHDWNQPKEKGSASQQGCRTIYNWFMLVVFFLQTSECYFSVWWRGTIQEMSENVGLISYRRASSETSKDKWNLQKWYVTREKTLWVGDTVSNSFRCLGSYGKSQEAIFTSQAIYFMTSFLRTS